ncbi:hypothetical protein K439DRAFT_418100 [Ramaria rubella]|nr:hypothetical protein K439DRAFT_418100 [Ramaria rubella]
MRMIQPFFVLATSGWRHGCGIAGSSMRRIGYPLGQWYSVMESRTCWPVSRLGKLTVGSRMIEVISIYTVANTTSASSGTMDLQSLFVALTATRYSIRSAIALLFYDYFLTFPEEVRHFWLGDWSFITVLFLFNRYFGMISALSYLIFDSASLSNELYVRFIWWISIGAIASIVNSELILLVRIYAVYQRDMRVLLATGGLIAASALVSLLIDIIGVPKGLSRASLGISGCAANVPSFFFAGWIPFLVVETVLCFLMGFRALMVFQRGTNSPLLWLLIRDSVTYFLTIVSVVLTNCLIWAVAPIEWAPFALSWEIVLPCVLGGRLLLNIRERSLNEPQEAPWRSRNESITFSNLRNGANEMPMTHSFPLDTFYVAPMKGDTVL